MAKRSQQAQAPKNGGQAKPVPLRFKLRNRFYEVLVLLHCLRVTHIRNGNTVPRSSDSGLESTQTVQQFRQLVNKLAHICDSSKGGDTVTAFAVLQTPSGVLYVFASNSRTEEGLEKTRQYIAGILNDLGKYSRDHQLRSERVISLILSQVLVFVRARAECYARTIYTQADKCIETCKGEETDEAEKTCGELRRLKSSAALASDRKTEDVRFSEICEKLIFEIVAVYDGPLDGFADKLQHENSCWAELRHATGRLLSYLHGVRILLSSRSRWPQLFENFEVVAVPSRPKMPNPLAGNIMKVRTADAIIGRMTSDPSSLEQYREEVKELQRFNLDADIQMEAEREDFKTLIHAEINLHDWLLRNHYNHPSKFFHGIKYIGCSKPTCKLCQHYLDLHPSGFSVRPGHGNLYIKWRAPDVFSDQGDEGVREREKMLIKVLEPIRQETLRTISEKAGLLSRATTSLEVHGISRHSGLSEYKKHDSNTDPTRNMYQTAYDGSVRDEDDALSMIGGDAGSDTEESSPAPSTESPFKPELTRMFRGLKLHCEEESDSDGEGEGGVKI